MHYQRHLFWLAIGFTVCVQIASLYEYSHSTAPGIMCPWSRTCFGWPFLVYYSYSGPTSEIYLSPTMLLANLFVIAGAFMLIGLLFTKLRWTPRFSLRFLFGLVSFLGASLAAERWMDAINATSDVRDWHVVMWTLRDTL